MKKQRHSRIWITIALLVACLALPYTCKSQNSNFSPSTYAVSGFHINQGLTYGIFGIANRITPKMAIFSAADLGGYSKAFSSVWIYYLPLTEKLTTGLILGPQVEIINDNPTYEESVTYLTGASGMIFVYHLTERTGIWSGFRYLFETGNLQPLKFGAGFMIRL